MRELNLPFNPYIVSEEEKKSVFKPGALVCVKDKTIFNVILSTIKRIENEKIYLALTMPFLENNILPGRSITCNILRQDFEYIAYGLVSNINTSGAGDVEFKISEINKFKNQRKEKRFFINISAKMMSNTNSSMYGIIKNLSLSGLCIISKEVFAKDDIIDVCFSNNSRSLPIQLKAKIVRASSCVGFKEYGLEIIDTGSSASAYKDILKELEQNELAVINSLKP